LTGRSSRGTFQTAASRGVHKPTQGLQVRPAALGFFLPPQKAILVTRATVFIDGANLYRGLKSIGVRAREIDTTKVARKLVQDRQLVEVRYYIGRVDRSGGRAHEANRALIERLESTPGVVLRLGYIQRIEEENPCAEELSRYLAALGTLRLPGSVFQELTAVATKHRRVAVFREKGVDVALAVDLVRLAHVDAFDVAYLVSGDGDFGPAIEVARAFQKKVIAAGPAIGRRLREAVNVSIRLPNDWFEDCRV
jgi:uncharacterized LabA/DUF88 family protein